MQLCRICLDTDLKLFCMKKYNLGTLLNSVTGIDMTNNLPSTLCWECAHRLLTCWRFRNKVLKSHNLLMDILKEKCYLSHDVLKTIDRHKQMLTSSLSYKVYEANHSDLNLYDKSFTRHEQTNEESDVLTNTFHFKNIEETDDFDYEDEDETKTDNYDLREENHIQENVFLNDPHISTDAVLLQHKNIIKTKDKKENNRRLKKNHKQKLVKEDRRRNLAENVLDKEVFTINYLSFEEQILEIKLREESSNYKNSQFRCTQCFKGFFHEEAYKCHMKRHTDESGPFQCEICKIHFKKQNLLRNHVWFHMQKFSCRRCPYVTTRRHAAKLHEDYHNGTKYICPHCQDVFRKFSTYMSHIRIKHPSDFVCELCGHSFVSTKGLSLHKHLKHRFDDHPVVPDGPRCGTCDVRFISQDALDTHLRLSARHGENAELKSITRKRRQRQPEEEKSVAQKEAAQRRRSSSKPEGPIPCEQCNIELPDSVSYHRHFRRSHPDKNRTKYLSMKRQCMCEVCGKMFQSLALLHDHSFTHTDSKQFKCAQCGKSFQRKYRLIAHRRLHADQRSSHACTVCGKRFSTTSNMQRHMVSHTGLKPFKCEMCGKCFKHASEKRAHITYVHLKKPWPKRSRGKRADDKQNQGPAQLVSPDVLQPLWAPCNEHKY